MKKRITALLLAFMMVFVAEAGPSSEAASKFTYEKIDKSQSFDVGSAKIIVDYYFKLAQLKGGSAAVKKINKTLKKASTNFFKKESFAIETAKTIAEGGDYQPEEDEYFCDFLVQEGKYYSSKYASIAETYVVNTGGVTNTFVTGRTYDLKTGKKVTDIKKFTKLKTMKKIKAALVKKAKKENSSYDTKDITSAKSFDFYLNKNGNVVVCFGPYVLGFGGWTKEFTLPGKYAK